MFFKFSIVQSFIRLVHAVIIFIAVCAQAGCYRDDPLPCVSCLENQIEFCKASSGDIWVWDREWTCESQEYLRMKDRTMATCLYTRLDDCGTTVVTRGEWAVATNEAALHPSTVIYGNEKAPIYKVSCLYNQKYDLSAVITPNNEKVVEISEDMSYKLKMSFCEDETCTTKRTHPMVFDEDWFFILVESEEVSENQFFGFKTCVVTPNSAQSEEIIVVQDGCGKGVAFETLVQENGRTIAKMEAFRLADASWMYLTCTMEICSAPCQTCNSQSLQSQRSVSELNLETPLGLGPLMPSTPKVLQKGSDGKYYLQENTSVTISVSWMLLLAWTLQ